MVFNFVINTSMKAIKTIIFSFLFSLSFTSQSYSQIVYQKIEIPIDKNQSHKDLQNLGIDIICGSEHTHRSEHHTIQLVLNNEQISLLDDQQISYKTLDQNYSKSIAKRNLLELPAAIKDLEILKMNQLQRGSDIGQDLSCIEQTWPAPNNFNLGSMGGMLTYTEMLAELDAMQSQYPNLITAKASASTSLTSIEGRAIQFVKISDNPNTNEAEPEVLYTGLHHAREPVSMMNLIFYMWYLLENYATDIEVKNMVDHTELFFIPCVNPDGYVYNQTTNPNGGGFWRKNRRNNGGSIGVDLNRNYGYQWGFPNGGSSGSPSSDTYRGPSAFSEPETQIIKEFVEARNIITAFNDHTSGDLHLYPWGYTPDASDDDELFHEMTEQMCWHNRYFYGRGNSTIYPTAGDSDDWFYGEETTKDKIMVWTPEVGDAGFWPSPSLVVPQSQRQMRMNMLLATMAANYGVVNDLTTMSFDNLNPSIDFSIQHLSSVPGVFTLNINPISPEIISVANSTLTSSNMIDAEIETLSTNLTLDASTAPGTNISFEITLNNGTYDLFTRTITKKYNPTVVFTDDFSNASNWNLGSWELDANEGFNANGCATDSEGSTSSNGTVMLTSNAIDLSNAQNAILEFYIKWDIDWNFDYAQVQVSTDASNWVDLCGNYTKVGTADGFFNTNQPTGAPLYDGIQLDWVREQFDLSAYDGTSSIYIRFLNYATGSTNRDGFYIDDLSIYSVSIAHCKDGIQNDDETGIDCGGIDCPPCPSCTDGIQNGNETGVDCGGTECDPCPVCVNMNLTIIMDNYPEDVSWEIIDANSVVVESGGNYGGLASGTIVTENFCLETGCYDIVMIDEYGDGLCCNEGNGSYALNDEENNVLASGGNYGSGETTNFCVTATNNCPTDLILSNFPVNDSTYYASNLISTGGIISSNKNITLSAGTQVELNAGFQTVIGASFQALIGGCSQ